MAKNPISKIKRVDSDKDHIRATKTIRWYLLGNRVFTVSKYYLTYYLLFTKVEGIFSVEENDEQPNNQISSIMEQTDIVIVPPYIVPQWMPETAIAPNPTYTMFFLYIHTYYQV